MRGVRRHHPDHRLNAALFTRARVHDFWAIYAGDVRTERPADGFQPWAIPPRKA